MCCDLCCACGSCDSLKAFEIMSTIELDALISRLRVLPGHADVLRKAHAAVVTAAEIQESSANDHGRLQA